MPTPPLSDEKMQETVEAVRKSGSIIGAARILGRPRTSVQTVFHRALKAGYPDPREDYFCVSPVASKQRSLADLLAHKRKEAERANAYEDSAQLIKIHLRTPGPIGIAAFGDPHVDAPGSDFNLLERHLKLAAERREYLFAGNMGDATDNWVGRLSRLYEQSTVTGRESWRLVEWMFRDSGVRWTWLLRGNHDAWSGKNDPLDWIASAAGVGLDRHWGARVAFQHPNGTETRMHARHDFAGNSIFNPLHALKRETLHGHRDDILIAAHRHSGADARDINGDGVPFVMVRTSGYKISDSFAYEKGFHRKPLHPAALIIVDPDEPRGSPNRIWVAPTFERGCEYLDFLRERYEARKVQTAAKRKR